MRAALLGLGLLALSGCGLKLEDFPVAYACDHHGGDGGRQCTDDWRCGLADRCFYRDAGDETLALDWLCEADVQCPDGWQCGVLVEGRRHCQQLGVGAPSPCTVSADCQGGWQCGLARACFDPTITDAGADTLCAADEHCPTGFRCGQEVDRQRHCLAVGVGADSRCVDDRGCEGGWRCDTDRQVCVLVPDVLDSGHLGALGAEVFNRRQVWPVPVKISMSRKGLVSGTSDGFLIDALHDGGVLHTTYFAEQNGSPTAIDEWVSLPAGRAAGEVAELVSTLAGPAVQWADRSIQLLGLDGGTQTLAIDAGLLRPWNPMYGLNTASALWTEGNEVHFIDGGGFTIPAGRDIVELVNLADSTWTFTTQGIFIHSGSGAAYMSSDAGMPAARTLAVSAGYLQNRGTADFVFLVPLEDGGAGLAPWIKDITTGQLATIEPVPPCPPSTTPVALSFGSDQGGGDFYVAAVTRCQRADGTSFATKTRFGSTQQGLFARRGAWAEDPVPFSGPFVVQTHAPVTRVVASRDRLLWSAHETNDQVGDADGLSLLADQPWHPMLLDRAPDAVLAFSDPQANQRVLLAASNGNLFRPAPLGLLSSPGVADTLVPLSVFANSPDWVVTNQGVLDVKATAMLQAPTMSAVPPAGLTIRAPATGITAMLELAGQLRTVMLVVTHDTVLAADVTDNIASFYAPPAQLTAVMSPTPGLSLTSLSIEGSSTSVLTGYLTTPSQTIRFRTSDLVHWALDVVTAPPSASWPVDAWAEGGRGRVGTGDGRVWSLPLMVELSQPFDAGIALDYARACGDLFATNSATGLMRTRPASDGGLPGWVGVDAVNAQFPVLPSRLYETLDGLVVGASDGRIVRVTPTVCP